MSEQDAVRLIEQARRSRREGRPVDAHRDFEKAVAIGRRVGAPRILVQALKGLGQIERDQGNGETALALYEEAVTICRQHDDPLMLAHTIRHVADIQYELGRADLAEPCYVEALALYRSYQQPPVLDLANAVRPFAILKDDAGEIEEAKRLWEEARDLYAAIDLREGVAESSARLARLNR